ncbi:MAG: M10 family metallopeptidase C-terminal domain-containing protein, partial [Oculatellaceae cyanobacterium Prado106]|nr:M10 family metallopeptidase C-terminal domain-containing protein [Oculatellaceae cyanobacterium Prado106]
GFLAGSANLTTGGGPGIDLPTQTSRVESTDPATNTRRTAKIDITPSGTTARISVKVDLNADGDFTDTNEAPSNVDNFLIPTTNGALPSTFKFGFASSTGNSTNIHEIRNLRITDALPGASFSGAGVTIGAGGVPTITTTEGGAAVPINIRLTQRPTSNVVLNFGGGDATEGTFAPTSLTFTPQNWDSPQVLTITPVDDAIADGSIPYTITTTFTSTDPNYQTLNPPDIAVTNNDNEPVPNPNVTLALTGSPLAENGGVATVTATLSTPTTVPVVIGLGFGGSATNGVDYTPSANSITIAPGGTIGTITLTGVPDTLTEPNEAITVDIATVTGGTEATPQTVTASIADGVTPAPNTPPAVPTVTPPAVTPGTTTAVTGLSATDPDGIGFYTITTIPPADQGTLFLGDPATGGTPITRGQVLTPAQINQVFFRSGAGFTETEFTYTATDSRGATSAPQRVPFSGGDGVCRQGTRVNGTNGRDRLNGQDGVNDIIFARGGNDRIRGLGCNDLIDGGAGNDRILGGTGRDTLRGRTGNDTILGGAGTDVLNGGLGNDRVDGGEGNDRVLGRRGLDLLIGGTGDDVLSGGLRNDRLRGGAGNDTVDGGRGDDFVKGGAGNDVLIGRTGRDTLVGFGGDDTIRGGLAADILVGGAGNDTLTGNRGRDIFEYRSLNDGIDTITDFAQNRDTINLSRISGGRSFSDFVRLTQSGGNTLLSVSDGGQIRELAILRGVTATSLSASNFTV